MEKLFFYRPVTSLLVLWIRKSAPESQEWIEDNIRINQLFCLSSENHIFQSLYRFPRLFLSIWCKLADKRTTPSYLADNGVNTVVISTLMTMQV